MLWHTNKQSTVSPTTPQSTCSSSSTSRQCIHKRKSLPGVAVSVLNGATPYFSQAPRRRSVAAFAATTEGASRNGSGFQEPQQSSKKGSETALATQCEDTIAAIVTGSVAQGTVSIIRVSGSDAIQQSRI
eukprot:1155621-Pelagomonas_calceolata.AAC.1